MGCGESKHNVATDNTITRKKSNAGSQSKKSKGKENVLETGTKDQETDSSPVQQQEGDHQNVNNNVGGGDHPVAEIGDRTENLALKEGDHKEKQGGGGGHAEEHEPTGRLISNESPSQYLSSRKREEAVDGIVSEQKSEKSDDNSPRLEARKESLFNNNEKLNNAVEATSLVEQTAGETKNEGASVKEEKSSSADICIAEGASAKEEKAAQQAEVSTPPPPPPTTVSVEKNQNAEKEQSLASPTKDLKTV